MKGNFVKETATEICLNGVWKIKGISPTGEVISFEGMVPGSALNEIVKQNGENVFYRDNADCYQQYEEYTFVYEKEFYIAETDKKTEICFENLDTYCDIYINNKYLDSCDNGFIPHCYDISKYVVSGSNFIEIYFDSPINRTRNKKKRSQYAFTMERLYTRRPQCTYGWDWTMRFVTCGIGGNVYIKQMSDDINVASSYIYTKEINEQACIGIDIELENYENGEILEFLIYDDERNLVQKTEKYCEESFVRLDFTIESPKLWYPIGYGKQPIYDFCVYCCGKEIHSEKFGIRTAQIIEKADKIDSKNHNKCLELKKSSFSKTYDENEAFSGFELKINGKSVMCKGANWVPCQPFNMGNTDERITEILELSAKAGVNMIRVWGGGAFETKHFYRECSRLGILVTQDFLMACGEYPEEEEWFLSHLKMEAEYAADLIRNEPCLVWWTGDNENAIKGTFVDENYRGRNAAYKAIAPVLYQKDPYRRFLPSSPYGGKKFASNTVGTTHNTQFMGDVFRIFNADVVDDYRESFKQFRARFIAEEPTMGAASLDTLKKFMNDKDIFGDDKSMWIYHTKTNPGLPKELFDYVSDIAGNLLGEFANGEDRLFKYQYVQYEWIRLSLEQVRREKGFCNGIIYWMLNDCWPAAISWSLIDYYTKPKAAYYSFKRAAASVIGSIDLEGDQYKLYVCNDGSEQTVKVVWKFISDDGKNIKIHKEEDVFLAETGNSIKLAIGACEVPENHFVVVDIIREDNTFDRCFYKRKRPVIKPCDNVEMEILSDTEILLKAKEYTHAVEFTGEAMFEDSWFSMLPGEEKVVSYTKGEETDIAINCYTFK